MLAVKALLATALCLLCACRDAGPGAASAAEVVLAASLAPLPALARPSVPPRSPSGSAPGSGAEGVAPAALAVPAAPAAPAATDAVLAALAAPGGELGVAPLDAPDEASYSELVIPDADTVAAAIRRARDAVPARGGSEKWRHIPEDRSGNPDASVSVGNATTGILVNGKPVPQEGDGWRVRGVTLSRGFHYGTDGLVGALTRAGAAVAKRWKGSQLLIGNLSRQSGGDIPPSVSHNTGRDADLGFYLCDRMGRPLPPPGDDYVTFDADGVSVGRTPPVYLDSPRNWAFVEALLTDPAVQVQYIFVADWLKELLLDYAIRSGADPDLIVRADQALQQPHNSSPHAEHFHLRLYCDMADRLAGCHDEGPVWPWIQRFDDVVQARIDALVDLYQSGDPAKRDYVRRQLDLLTVVPLSTPETGENPHEL